MLNAVNGYIDGNRVIVDESLAGWQGRNVVVTILDSTWNDRELAVDNVDNQEKRIKAAQKLSGLWKDHEEVSVDDMVRNMRRGRRFDS
jgi:hypothetical protein